MKLLLLTAILFQLLTLGETLVYGQTARVGPFSLDDIVDYWKNDVPCKPLTDRVNQRGIDFAATADALQRLRNAGICPDVIEMVRKKTPSANLTNPEVAAPIGRGKAFLDNGQYSEAVKEFELARAIDPKNTEPATLVTRAQKAMEAEHSLSSGRLSIGSIETLANLLSPRRLLTIVNNNGIQCMPRQDVMDKLSRNGTDDRLLVVIERKGLENEREIGKLNDAARAGYEQGQYKAGLEALEKSKALCPSYPGLGDNLDLLRSAQAAENKAGTGALDISDIVMLLAGKVSNLRVASLVIDRKVKFKNFSTDDEKAIKGAGGDIEVLTAIRSQTQAVVIAGRPKCDLTDAQQLLINSGFELVRQNKFNEALASAQQVSQAKPCSEKAWELLGDAQRGQQRFAEAVASYDQSLKLSDGEPLIWSKRGTVLQELSRDEEAVNSFNRALKINPRNVQTWVFKGLSFLKLNKCQDARKSFDEALSLDPKYQITLVRAYEAVRRCERP